MLNDGNIQLMALSKSYATENYFGKIMCLWAQKLDFKPNMMREIKAMFRYHHNARMLFLFETWMLG